MDRIRAIEETDAQESHIRIVDIRPFYRMFGTSELIPAFNYFLRKKKSNKNIEKGLVENANRNDIESSFTRIEKILNRISNQLKLNTIDTSLTTLPTNLVKSSDIDVSKDKLQPSQVLISNTEQDSCKSRCMNGNENAYTYQSNTNKNHINSYEAAAKAGYSITRRATLVQHLTAFKCNLKKKFNKRINSDQKGTMNLTSEKKANNNINHQPLAIVDLNKSNQSRAVCKSRLQDQIKSISCDQLRISNTRALRSRRSRCDRLFSSSVFNGRRRHYHTNRCSHQNNLLRLIGNRSSSLFESKQKKIIAQTNIKHERAKSSLIDDISIHATDPYNKVKVNREREASLKSYILAHLSESSKLKAYSSMFHLNNQNTKAIVKKAARNNEKRSSNRAIFSTKSTPMKNVLPSSSSSSASSLSSMRYSFVVKHFNYLKDLQSVKKSLQNNSQKLDAMIFRKFNKSSDQLLPGYIPHSSDKTTEKLSVPSRGSRMKSSIRAIAAKAHANNSVSRAMRRHLSDTAISGVDLRTYEEKKNELNDKVLNAFLNSKRCSHRRNAICSRIDKYYLNRQLISFMEYLLREDYIKNFLL
jgi:hypothetical protein